jgi:ubiquinol-cytochrome c reductase iron-sulfur subunit/rieske iron-sulfur protein
VEKTVAGQDHNNDDGIACCLLHRRTVLVGLAGVAAVSIVGGALGQEAAALPPQPGDLLVRASGDDQTTPLTPADLDVGAGLLQAWPADPVTGEARSRSLFNLLVLSRWDDAELSADTLPNAAGGVVANTIICTHAACEVTDWVADAKIFECPCHLSRFDPKRNGAVVQGPATRKLPSIALGLEGERLVIAGAFDSRVGGDAE